jgi:hypothetical protein
VRDWATRAAAGVAATVGAAIGGAAEPQKPATTGDKLAIKRPVNQVSSKVIKLDDDIFQQGFGERVKLEISDKQIEQLDSSGTIVVKNVYVSFRRSEYAELNSIVKAEVDKILKERSKHTGGKFYSIVTTENEKNVSQEGELFQNKKDLNEFGWKGNIKIRLRSSEKKSYSKLKSNRFPITRRV